MVYPDKINALVDIAGTSTLAVVGHAARHNDLNDALDELKVVLTVPAANTLALAPGGTEKMRIDSAGLITGSGTSLGAWTAWTPTFTGFTTGNATLDFAYSKIGKTVHLRGSMIFGSTSAIPGPFDLTLPLNLSSGYTFVQNIGRVTVYDVGGSLYFGDMVKISGGTGGDTVRCVLNLASGTTVANQEISATVPMTWVTGDVLFINGTFEAA